MVSPIDVSPPQVDEAEHSSTVPSLVTEVLESVQVPSGKPQDVASSLGTALELSTTNTDNTLALIVLLLLSVVLPQSATKVIGVDIVIRPVTGLQAIIVEVLLHEMEQVLAAAKDREDELSQAIEAFWAVVNVTDEQSQIAFACVLSLEEERTKKVLPSEEEIKAKAQECLHQDKVFSIFLGLLDNRD